MRLRKEKGTQRAPQGIETIRLIPETKKHLLGDILSLGGIIKDASRESVDRAAVSSIHLGERHLTVTTYRRD